MSLICMWMKSHFRMKGWAPRLALRKRLKVIRKWPIKYKKFNSKLLIVDIIIEQWRVHLLHVFLLLFICFILLYYYRSCILKGHLSPLCAYAAVWFLIRRKIFQSWYMWEKSFSIDLMRRVKIVIPILKNGLVNHDRFKRHSLSLELKTVENSKYDVLERGFSKRLQMKATCNWSTWKKR